MHLCERLSSEGAEVLCVDNFFTGARKNIAHLIGNPMFELMRHDVTFPLYVEVDQPITIYGEGKQTRSFCYVDDLVDGLVRTMNSPEDVTGPINLGNPGEFTIRELAEQVIALTGSRSRLSFLPLPQDDPRQRRPDILKAEKALGWTPKIALKEGLVRTISYFDTILRDL